MISIKYFSFTLSVVLFLSAYYVSNPPRQDTSQSVYLNDLSLKKKAITFLNSFNDSKNINFSIISDLQFTQHDLSLKDGKEEYVNSILSTIKNDFTLEIIRALQDKDYVFIHSKQTSSYGSNIVYDVFRFSENLIVEHWINLEEVNPPNPSGRTQIDGTKKIVNKNKIFVEDYLTTILLEKRLEDVPAYLNGNEYIQHNSNVADGVHSILDLMN